MRRDVEAATTLVAGADAVTVDLDDTLVSYRRSPGEVLAAAYDAVGVEQVFPVGAYYDRFAAFNERADSMADLRERCFAALAEERGHEPDLGREVARSFADERDHANVDWCAGAREFLDALDARGVPYAVVTNGPPDAQAAKARAVGLDERAVEVVFAGHDYPAKPAAEPFEAALVALGVGADDAVHLGDSPDSDAVGALAAGVAAVVVGDREPLPAEAVRVPSLTTLVDRYPR